MQISVWSSLHVARQLVLSGVDNVNVAHWLFRGRGRGGISVRLTSQILHWGVKYDTEEFTFS